MSHSLAQDGIRTTFCFSIFELLIYVGSLTFSCIQDFYMYKINYYVLLLISYVNLILRPFRRT